MAVTGRILREPDLREIGTFRADEDSIILDIDDKKVRAKIRRGMQQEWIADDEPEIIEGSRIQDRGTLAKPENLSTLQNFFVMLDSIGFVHADLNIEE